ncbi:MAG TPA: hypothetical protein VEZ90_13285 [Blastocatellia bacterium]|nr:hypothetical protein [Blastocatellia bacterium]
MLTIELRQPSPDVCPDCEDSGVVLPGKRKLLTDSGVFCSCAIGAQKWDAMRDRMTAFEESVGPSPAPRNGAVQYREVSTQFVLR